MPNTTIEKLVELAADQAVDASYVRWSKPFWVDALNLAIRAVCGVKPDAYVKNALFTCVAGARQSLPDDAIALLKVERNENGQSIRALDNVAVLDDYRPDWRSIAPASDSMIESYIYDSSNPLVVDLYPPARAGQKVHISYSANPSPITSSSSSEIPLKSNYDNALVKWMLYLAFNRDSEIPGNEMRSQREKADFYELLGVKNGAQQRWATEFKQNQNRPV